MKTAHLVRFYNYFIIHAYLAEVTEIKLIKLFANFAYKKFLIQKFMQNFSLEYYASFMFKQTRNPI